MEEISSLRELRIAKKLSLQALSDISGITIANLSLIENNKSYPTLRTRKRLEHLMGQAIDFPIPPAIYPIIRKRTIHNIKSAYKNR